MYGDFKLSFQVSSDRWAWNSSVDSLAGSHCVAYVFTNTRSIGIDWLFKYIGKSSLGKGGGLIERMAQVSVKVKVSLDSWTPNLVPGLPELMLKMKVEAPDYFGYILYYLLILIWYLPILVSSKVDKLE